MMKMRPKIMKKRSLSGGQSYDILPKGVVHQQCAKVQSNIVFSLHLIMLSSKPCERRVMSEV